MEEEKSKTIEEVTETSNLNNGKKNHTAIIALIILVLVVAIGFRGYYFYKKMQLANPVKATAVLINDFGNSSKETIKKYDKYLNGKKPVVVTIDGDVGEIKFKAESGIDLNKKILTTLVNMSGIGDDELYIDGTVKEAESTIKVSKEGNAYLIKQDSKELFNYLSNYFEQLNGDYSKKLVGYLADSFEETFTKEDFTKTKEKSIPTYGEKEVTTTKYTTTIDGDKLAKLLSNFIDKLAKDDEFTDSMIEMSKLTGEELTKEDIKESFEMIKEAIKDPADDVNIKYTIETYKSDIISASLSADGISIVYGNYNGVEGASIKMDGATIEFKDSKTSFSAKIDIEGQAFEITYDKKTNEYSVKYAGMIFVSGTYEEIENRNSIEVKLTFNSALLGMKGNINSKLELVDALKDKSYKDALNIEDGDNANKLFEELEDNEFINSLMEMFESMFDGSSAWDSIDGLDL